MCGRFNVNDDSFVQLLLEGLEVANPQEQRHSPFITPCQPISVVLEEQGQRRLQDATWWLLLEPNDNGFKPSRYTSFNTRYDKVNQAGSAGYQSYRSQRCIIPASGFGETQFVNKKAVSYHNMTATEEALAFAGLYRLWRHPRTGELAYSCSIITNAPHPKFANIHTKASPAMLAPHQYDMWLDPTVNDPNQLNDVLQPRIVTRLSAQAINKPSLGEAIGNSFVIEKDLL